MRRRAAVQAADGQGAGARPYRHSGTVIPAKAGTHFDLALTVRPRREAGLQRGKTAAKWVPALAGTTGGVGFDGGEDAQPGDSLFEVRSRMSNAATARRIQRV